jgi:transcriptional regulator with XRE-family HTH domain/quercetin dioxygenase-like cupin family protein
VPSTEVPPIGARLRAARRGRGLSVRGLARDIGVSASLISQIETDKSSPSVSTLYSITTALGISIEDLFGDPPPAAADSPDEPGDDGADEPVAVAAGAPAVTRLSGDGAVAALTSALGVSAAVADPGLAGWRTRDRRIGPVVKPDGREVLTLDSGVTWELLGQIPHKHVDFLLITYQPGGSSSSSGHLMRHTGTEFGFVISGELTLTLGFETHRLVPGDAVSFDSSTPHGYRNETDEPAIGVWFVLERSA